MSPIIHNGNAEFDRCYFAGSNVPLTFGEGSSGNISRSVFANNSVADIAYDNEVTLKITETYANRLLDLTDGSITNFGRHLNYIAYEFISTVDYSRTIEIATYLANFLHDNRWVRVAGESAAFGLAKTLVENVFNINLPF